MSFKKPKPCVPGSWQPTHEPHQARETLATQVARLNSKHWHDYLEQRRLTNEQLHVLLESIYDDED